MPKFSLAPVDEVPLDYAPLAKVLMQVQFSRTPQLVADAAELLIAELLGRYPVRRRQVAAAFPSLVVNGQMVDMSGSGQPSTVLLFSDTAATWQVSVTDTSVSLETSDYSSRDDFCGRAEEVLAALAAVALPPVVDRVGVRYIDRLVGDQLPRVPEFVIPQLQVLWGSVDPDLPVQHSITDSLIAISSAERLQVRSGLMPAGAAFDPALPVVSEPSWLLDMDVYTIQAGFAFDPSVLTSQLRRFAEAAYAFFRFATTPAFEHEHRSGPAPAAQDLA